MEIALDCSKYLVKINKIEALKNLLDFNIGSVLTEIVDVEKSLETKAFLLLYNSARNTNEQLSKAYGQLQINSSYDLVSIAKNLEKEYKKYLEQKITIKKDFFDNIIKSDNSYLIASFDLFRRFCEQLKIKLPTNIRIEYYIHFRENLKEEFQNNKERYQELVDFFSNPIIGQNETLYDLFDYFTSYKNYYTKPLQAESETKETLQDLYVEPFFSIHKNNLLEIPKDRENESFYQYSDKITIHEFFSNFLANKQDARLKSNYDMVFVLGQPGQGKTSFCYKLLHDYIESHSDLPPIPIIFVKIRDLVAKDFINDPFGNISEYYKFINFQDEELILVLDGLDESYMSGGITNEDLRNLYERLKKRSNRKIKIILTSRFNFLNVNDSCLDKTLVLHINELTDIQIKEYCNKFKQFYPENSLVSNIDSILETKKYDHIKELLRQAVLIYFIAISDIEIEEKDSKSRIYDKIFDSLAQRSWDTNGQLDYINPKLKSDPSLYKSYLREYIRNIAFEIYHSPKLYITVNKLLELDATKLFIKRCFSEDLHEAKDKIKEFSKYLLISFYFQQTNKDNTDAALEFFHNSLWEFLTAEHLWEQNKKIILKRDEYQEFEMIPKEDYFNFLSNSIGNKSINEFSVTKNLVEIIDNEDEEIRKDVFSQSIDLFYELAEDDYLYSYERKNCLLSPFEKATCIFTLMWIFVHESNKVDQKKITANSKILDFLFINSDLTFSNEVKNLIILDDFINVNHRRLYHLKFENCLFRSELFYYRLYKNNVKNTDFKNTLITRFECEDCSFENINITDNYLASSVSFSQNTFKNLKIHNTQMDYREWFNEFIDGNSFDEDFLKNHYIDMRIEKNHRKEDEERFYIMCKTFKVQE